MNSAKAETITATTGEPSLAALEVVASWPSDVILTSDLSVLMADEHGNPPASGTIRGAALDAGMTPRIKPLWFGGKSRRYWIVRNPETWANAQDIVLAGEIRRGRPGVGDGEPIVR